MSLRWSPWIELNVEKVQQLGPRTAGLYEVKVDTGIIEYPTAIREAVLLEAGLWMETRGYRRQIGNFETGIITPFGRTFSQETTSKLTPFRKWPI